MIIHLPTGLNLSPRKMPSLILAITDRLVKRTRFILLILNQFANDRNRTIVTEEPPKLLQVTGLAGSYYFPLFGSML